MIYLLKITKMKKILKFLLQVILSLIATVLIILADILTFIILLCTKGWEALDYFDNTGYRLDVVSASRNRTLWNAILVKKWGIMFQNGTTHTISYHIGANYNKKTLKPFWIFLYWFLYVVDFSTWKEWGHCQSSVDYFNWLNEEK